LLRTHISILSLSFVSDLPSSRGTALFTVIKSRKRASEDVSALFWDLQPFFDGFEFKTFLKGYPPVRLHPIEKSQNT
jgi:hypothetical protein